MYEPETPTWRIHSDPGMWPAGARALMLQALHPVAIHGVWQNSAFREDPLGRLWRTASYIGVQTAGTPEQARAAGERVRRVHRAMRFTDPATGRLHRVDEPDLLLWVHCAEVGSFLEVVRRSGLRLTRAEADQYVREQRASSVYVGLEPRDVPGSVGALRDYFAEMRPRLKVTAEARAACVFLLWPSVRGSLNLVKPAWFPIAALGYACLPRWAREAYGLLPELPGAGVTAGLRAFRRAGLCVPASARRVPRR